MKSDSFSIWALYNKSNFHKVIYFVVILFLLTQAIPTQAAKKEKFTQSEIFMGNDLVTLSYPLSFSKNGDLGGLLTLMGTVQSDSSIPTIFIRSYQIPADGGLQPVMRLVEDRYRKLSAYHRTQRRVNGDFFIVNRSYHLPGSEIGVEEMTGYRRKGETLLEIRCVASMTTHNDFQTLFKKVLAQTGFKKEKSNAEKREEERALRRKINISADLIGRGEFDKALLHLEPLLKNHPNKIELIFLIGKTQRLLSQPLKALPYFEKLTQLQPDSLEWQVSLAENYLEAGKLQQIPSLLKQAPPNKGNRQERSHYYFVYGKYYHQIKKYDNALRMLEKGLEAKPGDPEIHYFMGLVLEERGRIAEAILHFRESVNHSPSSLKARTHLSQLFMEVGEYSNALYHLLYLTRSESRDLKSLRLLYRCLRELGRKERAERVKEQILEITGEDGSSEDWVEAP